MDKVGRFRIIGDRKYGYRRIDPIPSEQELQEFYHKKYYNLIKRGGRAPELRKSMRGGKTAQKELNWLKLTLYQEIDTTLKQFLPHTKRRLIDIGAGTGDFVKFMEKNGWKAMGIEPSKRAAYIAEKKGLRVENISLEDYFRKNPRIKSSFDAATMVNLLEHVPYPQRVLTMVKALIKPRAGVLCIRVPNDFNILQRYAGKRLKNKKWWVAIPDHINYFSIASLQKFLASNGFEVIDKTVDFPMEIFLLMGDDYTVNPKIGSICHNKRINFELSLPYALRRELYRKLAEIGIGRDCIIYARRKR